MSLFTIEDFYNATAEQLDSIISSRLPEKIEERGYKIYAAMYFSYPQVSDEIKIILQDPNALQKIRASKSANELRYEYFSVKDKIIYTLNRLSQIYVSSGDVYRSKSFEKAAKSFLTYNGGYTLNDLTKAKDIGKSSAEVIMDIVNNGRSSRLTDLERTLSTGGSIPITVPTPSKSATATAVAAVTDEQRIIKLFESIHGVGRVTAERLYAQGYRDLNQIYNDFPQYRMAIQYKDDLDSKIPRSEIEQWKRLLERLFGNPQLKGPNLWSLAGSYRRGEPESSDIDLIFSDYSPQDVVTALGEYVVGKFSLGPDTGIILVRLPGGKVRQMDVTTYKRESFFYGLLHASGSAQFLILAQIKAQQLGAKLNKDRLVDNNGKEYPANSEEDIFHYLRLKYLPPNERRRDLFRLEVI